MGDDDLYLRVVVDSGGCSGFQYVFNMYNKDKDEYITEDDMEFGRDGAKVIVDSGSFEFIKGATVDFEQELIRSAFAVVNNPLSESACGCGSSFAVKNFEANPALD
jgi:iron-sulfur cluster assembly accessory protein